MPRVLSGSLDGAGGAQPLLRGDRVRLLSNSDRFANRVVIKGAVQRPGVFGYEEGMRVSDLIGNVDRDLAENVDYNYALVVSEDALSGEINARTFSVQDAIGDRGGDGDPILQPRDQVLFFNNVAAAIGAQRAAKIERELEDEEEESRRAQGLSDTDQDVDERRLDEEDVEERQDEEDSPNRRTLLAPVIARLEAQASPSDPVRIVRVDGSVHAPGDYPLGNDMTIRDLLAAAGGMRRRLRLGGRTSTCGRVSGWLGGRSEPDSEPRPSGRRGLRDQAAEP